jgi:hypothetical protein
MTRPEDMTDAELFAEYYEAQARLENDPAADNRREAHRAAHAAHVLVQRGYLGGV